MRARDSRSDGLTSANLGYTSNKTAANREGGQMSPTAQELAQCARLYCELIESSTKKNNEWLREISRLLPKLHAAVASLNNDHEPADHSLMADLDARFELFTHLRELLGERDGYWLEFDVAEDGQSMSGSLADDLTDIYCELKHGLRLMDGEPGAAVAGLREGFRVHWGQHLVDAERHLYELRARGDLQ